jgi:hypothetical protein
LLVTDELARAIRTEGAATLVSSGEAVQACSTTGGGVRHRSGQSGASPPDPCGVARRDTERSGAGAHFAYLYIAPTLEKAVNPKNTDAQQNEEIDLSPEEDAALDAALDNRAKADAIADILGGLAGDDALKIVGA